MNVLSVLQQTGLEITHIASNQSMDITRTSGTIQDNFKGHINPFLVTESILHKSPLTLDKPTSIN